MTATAILMMRIQELPLQRFKITAAKAVYQECVYSGPIANRDHRMGTLGGQCPQGLLGPQGPPGAPFGKPTIAIKSHDDYLIFPFS